MLCCGGLALYCVGMDRSYVLELGDSVDGLSKEGILREFGAATHEQLVVLTRATDEFRLLTYERCNKKFGYSEQYTVMELWWAFVAGGGRTVWLMKVNGDWIAFDGVEHRGVKF